MGVSNLPDCHRCGGRPAYQWTRAASANEAAAQRLRIAEMQGRSLDAVEIEARYGPLREAVTGCAEHHLGSDDADSGADLRSLIHGSECAGHGECVCADGAAEAG